MFRGGDIEVAQSFAHQCGDAAAVERGDFKDLLEAEAVEFVDVRSRNVAVDFVDDEDDGFPCGTEAQGDFLVEPGKTAGDVDDEEYDVGVGNGDADLFFNGLIPEIDAAFFTFSHAETAGVDEAETAAVCDSGRGDAVAGHSAVEVDDRLAFFENGIEKRGFADVWSADDGDGRQRICLSLLFTHGHVPYFCRRSGGRPRCR